VLLFRSGDETNDESLLPPLPQTENECTKRKISSRQMNDPLYREKLERQMESALGKIEIVDGYIIRWMPEAERKGDVSSIFEYVSWADDQGGKFCVGNVGLTIGNNTRAPDAFFRQATNIHPSTQQMLTPTAPPNLIIETEHVGKCGEAEQKITDFWLQNGVQEGWLVVIPDIVDIVPHAPVGAPPVPLPVVQMTQVRPTVPYIAIYVAGNNPPLLGYFPIDWHMQFQPPQESLLFGAPPINCDRFMRRLC
jgi:Uma2 family endonuclease